jgi:chromosome segregation ATPase
VSDTPPPDLDDRSLAEELGHHAEKRRKLRAHLTELRAEVDETQAAISERTSRIDALRAEFTKRWQSKGPQAVLAWLESADSPDIGG